MGGAAFRMYFGDRSATAEELARIESITIEQEMEMAWEARIRMVLCLDDQGRWKHQPADTAQPFSRIRVEIKLGEGEFKPLIDGPVAGFAAAMSSEPGRSVANLIVRDDSVMLNREESTEIFTNETDSALADQMFARCDTITGRDIIETGNPAPTTVKRGTPIQFLRDLAMANGYLAYVLPGEAPGQSVGVFRAPSSFAPELPALVLLGEGRNMIEAEFTDDSEGAETTSARSLRISDQQVVSAQRSIEDQDLLGSLPQASGDGSALRELPPEDNTREDPEAQTQNQNQRASYALHMTGSVMPGCYDGVLAPYENISIQAGDTPYSGVWLIHKVTHHISPSIYTQELQAKRNALSDVGAGPMGLVSGVF